LQKELDSFVETDEIVRRNLDRKQKVDDIRTKVGSIQQTQGEGGRNRSPRRESGDRYGPNTTGRSPIHQSQYGSFQNRILRPEETNRKTM
jgi:hypothetical protein